MSPDQAVAQAVATGSADLGTYAAPELAAVGFPVVVATPVSAVAISTVRSSMRARGVATADSHGAIREAAGDLATWQQLNSHTRGVLVCIGDHRFQAQVLADAPGRPVLALTYETVGGELPALAPETDAARLAAWLTALLATTW